MHRGEHEAIDLRDGTDALRGKGVQQALDQVNGPIAEMLTGQNAKDQSEIDNLLITLDGTPLKSKLGGNAMVASSLAVLHAAAAWCPAEYFGSMLQINMNTQHSIARNTNFWWGCACGSARRYSGFMIMVPGANSFDEVMEITNEVYFAAGSIMEQKGNGMSPTKEVGGLFSKQ